MPNSSASLIGLRSGLAFRIAYPAIAMLRATYESQLKVALNMDPKGDAIGREKWRPSSVGLTTILPEICGFARVRPISSKK